MPRPLLGRIRRTVARATGAHAERSEWLTELDRTCARAMLSASAFLSAEAQDLRVHRRGTIGRLRLTDLLTRETFEHADREVWRTFVDRYAPVQGPPPRPAPPATSRPRLPAPPGFSAPGGPAPAATPWIVHLTLATDSGPRPGHPCPFCGDRPGLPLPVPRAFVPAGRTLGTDPEEVFALVLRDAVARVHDPRCDPFPRALRRLRAACTESGTPERWFLDLLGSSATVSEALRPRR